MNLIIVIFCIIFITLIGYAIIDMIQYPQSAFLEKIGISYGMGIGYIVIIMFIYSLLGIPWIILLIILPSLLIFCKYLYKRRNSISKIKYTLSVKLRISDKILLILIVFLVLFVLTESILRPLPSWDGWASWFLGGKILFIDNKIYPSSIIFTDNLIPPGIHILIAFVYKIIGSVDDTNSLLIFAAFYVYILILYFSILRKFLSIREALVFTFLYGSLQNIIRHSGKYDVGYADLPLSYYFLCTTVFFIKSLVKPINSKNILLLGIFAGLGTYIKNEGFAFYLVVTILISITIIVREQLRQLLYILPGLIITFIWKIYAVIQHFPDQPFVSTHFQISRFFIILLGITQEFLNIVRWNILWIAFLGSVFLLLMSKKHKMLLALILLQLMIYILVYFETPIPVYAHIKNSFDRLLIHLAPIAMVIIAYSYNYILRNKIDNDSI